MSRIISIPRAILDFEQREMETIGIAWAKFLALIHACLDLSLPDGILLHLFCLGIDMEVDLCLDMIARGHFTHKNVMEQVKFLKSHVKC
jgi:hypothetical protein